MTRREQIRLAAVDAIAHDGFYETTIQDIASKADVSVGTIYNYFHSKEEILGCIFEVEYQRRTRLLKTLLLQQKPVSERFAEFLRLHFADLQQNPALGKLLIQECRFPLRKEFAPMKDYASQLPKLLGQLLDPEDSSGLTGTAAFGALQALSMRYLLLADIDLKAAIKVMTDLFCPSP